MRIDLTEARVQVGASPPCLHIPYYNYFSLSLFDFYAVFNTGRVLVYLGSQSIL